MDGTDFHESEKSRIERVERNPQTSELVKWFSVSGDMDDFIFYGEPEKNHSER